MVAANDARWFASLKARLPSGHALPADLWAERHRRISTLLWLHVPAIFVFARYQGETVTHSAFETAIVALVALVAAAVRHNRLLSPVAAAVGLMTASAVLVHLSGGQIEMHFHYFVMVGVVTLYQDWKPFLVAIGYVVFHHGVVGVLSPESVYNHPAALDAPWRWAAVHGLFIAGMSAAGIASWRLNEVLLWASLEKQTMLAEAQALAQIGSWEWDLRTGELRGSEELLRLVDAEGATWTGWRADTKLHIHPDDRGAVAAAIDQLLREGTEAAVDLRVLLKDGTERWLHLRGAVSATAGDAPIALAGTIQDISERKRSEADLREALSLLGATLDSTADGILVVDHDGRITSFNERFVQMWQVPREILDARDDDEALGAVVSQVRDPESFVAKIRELYAQPEADSHDVIEFVDGRLFERHSKPQRVGGTSVGRVWSFRDITEQHRLEHALAHQAFHDALTGLANPVLFRDRVDHALARARSAPESVAVLFVDLDNFKTVNDSLGHTAGDEVLVATAARLRDVLRPEDTAARLGGDEFAVLIEDVGRGTDATLVAETLVAALRAPVRIADRDVFVAASIGVAFGAPNGGADQLLRNADLAMYTAKRRGKDRTAVFEAAMHTAAVERLELESDLRRALDAGELAVHYQPIVTLASGRITGVEALVRWHHPERGLLPPASFIPVAEETGLICELGWQVLERACRQVRGWQLQHGRPLSLSVNLSPRQLQDDRLLERVSGALAASGLAGSSLVLEITEGAMMQDTEATIARLHSLKGFGLRLAVDDFGTGYSSLSYLQRFPVDVLKIDRSFVSSIDNDDHSASLARSIVSLAATLELQAVAEGIETEAQRDQLAAVGCDLAQGYYFAKPMDAASIEALLLGDEIVRPRVA